MKNYFVSAFTAIALAVPLGIGGLAFTASPAGANLIEQAKHHFSTCSRHVFWKCHGRIHKSVIALDNPIYILYGSRWLPRGSNGVDDGAYVRLYDHWNYHGHVRRSEGNQSFEDRDHVYYAEQALESIFSSSDLAHRQDLIDRYAGESTRSLRDAGIDVVSPYERGRILAEIERQARAELARQHLEEEERKRREEELRAANDPDYAVQRIAERVLGRSIDDCRNVGGRVGISAAGNAFCDGGTGSVDIFGGFDPASPGIYPTGLQITPVEPLESLAEIEDIEEHRRVTSDNRATIVTIVEEFNTLEERVLAHNDRIAENSFLVEAVADRLVDVDDRAKKNTAGIALGYALGTPGLLADKRFAFGGGIGSFEGENAVAFTLTGRITDSIVANVGGGMAGSGDTGVNGFKGTISFQW